MIVTERQLEILSHAIGLPKTSLRRRRLIETLDDCYRNHYLPAGPRMVDCERLSAAGYLREITPEGGLPMFVVTDEGFEIVRDAGLVSRQGRLYCARR